jgi:FkbM family methyltransferase
MDTKQDDYPYEPINHPDISLIIGFEPNKRECNKLNYDSGNHCCYLPEYIGDGNPRTFRICNQNMTSSFYEPNIELLEKFQNLAALTQVIKREEVETKRLDDMQEELSGADYLKIDVQGAELDVFKGASKLLEEEILVVHTEVCFVPLYRFQPLFAEIDIALRLFGFLFHRFGNPNLCGRAFKPLFIQGKPNAPISQALWADAIYVKDFTKFEDLSVDKLLKLAIILNDVYGSIDLANLALEHYDKKSGSQLATIYRQTLVSGNGKNEV